jgi:hypothetical protein
MSGSGAPMLLRAPSRTKRMASRPQADVVEFQEQIDGDQRGHQREEDVKIGNVVLVVPGGPSAEKRPDVVDPLEHEEREDAKKDPQKKDPPEDEHEVQILEPGQEMEIGECKVEGIGQPQDHRREDGEIKVNGQRIRKKFTPLEVEEKEERDDGGERDDRRREEEELPAHGGQDGATDSGVDQIVDQEFSAFGAALPHRVEEKNEGQDEGEVKGPVPPLLKNAESGRIDVEDREDQGHRVHQLQCESREFSETELRIVFGDLVDILDHMPRHKGALFFCRWSVVHLISSSCD